MMKAKEDIMQEFLNKGIDLLTEAGGKLILALLIFLIGRAIIKKIYKIVTEGRGFQKLDPTVKSFLGNFIKILLYVVLVIAIISVLGVPMASVITVLASAGVAVGMALQGSLANLAGGIMLLIFRPFNVGDYVAAAGDEGTVEEITVFYTILKTIDNKKVTIPNGALMNANVVNFTADDLRRIDMVFSVGKDADIQKVQDLILETIKKNTLIIPDGEAPEPAFARLSGGTNEAMEFTLRAWCKTGDYWTAYYDLNQGVAEALGAAGVNAPGVRIVTDK